MAGYVCIGDPLMENYQELGNEKQIAKLITTITQNCAVVDDVADKVQLVLKQALSLSAALGTHGIATEGSLAQ